MICCYVAWDAIAGGLQDMGANIPINQSNFDWLKQMDVQTKVQSNSNSNWWLQISHDYN